MIRITFMLRRKAGLSYQEFSDYWQHEHGPRVASVSRKLGMLRYVQVRTIDDPVNAAMARARGGMEPVWDGVAEVWFENRAAMVAAGGTAEGRAAAVELIKDEAEFIDLAQSTLWLGYEYPQVNAAPENLLANERNTLVKLYFPLRAGGEHSNESAQHYWRTTHGPIIRRQAHGSGIERYVQVHRALDDELCAPMRTSRGCEVAPYLGHAELWFDRAALQIDTPERAEAGKRAIADESTFIDFSRSTMWLAKERCFVDNR